MSIYSSFFFYICALERAKYLFKEIITRCLSKTMFNLKPSQSFLVSKVNSIALVTPKDLAHVCLWTCQSKTSFVLCECFFLFFFLPFQVCPFTLNPEAIALWCHYCDFQQQPINFCFSLFPRNFGTVLSAPKHRGCEKKMRNFLFFNTLMFNICWSETMRACRRRRWRPQCWWTIREGEKRRKKCR